jgi:hypothetical protein
MARLVPHLMHLQPPGGIAGIRLDRFSPNFFDAAERGFVDVSPLPAYRHVYPLDDEALMNLAYHFTFRYADGRDVNAYIRPLLGELRRWMSTRDAGLFMVDVSDRLAIWDLRPASTAPVSVLSGLERFLYLECDAIRGLEALTRQWGKKNARAEVVRCLDALVERGLMLERGGHYLSLAVRLGDYEPSRPVVNRFFAVAKALGEPTAHGLRVPLKRLNGSEGYRTAALAKPGGSFPRYRSRRLSPSQFCVDGKRGLLVEFRRRDH